MHAEDLATGCRAPGILLLQESDGGTAGRKDRDGEKVGEGEGRTREGRREDYGERQRQREREMTMMMMC